ncbi:TPA: hypothetical protein ACH3X1_004207 [Trebouxia sp. C0004]
MLKLKDTPAAVAARHGPLRSAELQLMPASSSNTFSPAQHGGDHREAGRLRQEAEGGHQEEAGQQQPQVWSAAAESPKCSSRNSGVQQPPVRSAKAKDRLGGAGAEGLDEQLENARIQLEEAAGQKWYLVNQVEVLKTQRWAGASLCGAG